MFFVPPGGSSRGLDLFFPPGVLPPFPPGSCNVFFVVPPRCFGFPVTFSLPGILFTPAGSCFVSPKGGEGGPGGRQRVPKSPKIDERGYRTPVRKSTNGGIFPRACAGENNQRSKNMWGKGSLQGREHFFHSNNQQAHDRLPLTVSKVPDIQAG